VKLTGHHEFMAIGVHDDGMGDLILEVVWHCG
jgi:hypothetical protein